MFSCLLISNCLLPSAHCLVPISNCQLPNTLPPSPSPRVQFLGSKGGSITVGPSERRLVANFWWQVLPHMVKLLLQVAKLSQDPKLWSQNDAEIAQLGGKMPLSSATSKILKPTWTPRTTKKHKKQFFQCFFLNFHRFNFKANLTLNLEPRRPYLESRPLPRPPNLEPK